MTDKPTPRPWELGIAGNYNIVYFDGDDIHAVAQVPRLADAQLVIRAVNSHDALLAACEGMAAFARDVWGDTSDLSPRFMAVLAAIEKATEPTQGEK